MAATREQYRTIAVMIDSGKVAQARAALARILAKGPADRNANVMMRHTLRKLGEHRQALYYAERAMATAPDDPDLLSITGQSQFESGLAGEGERTLRRAIEKSPTHVPSLIALANLVGLSGRFVETAELAARALSQAQGEASAIGMLASALIHLGRADEAVVVLKRAMLEDPTNLALLSLLCGAQNYATRATREDIIAAHRAFGRAMDRAFKVDRTAHAGSMDPERRLRVGAISADFRAHALMCFFEPLVERLDRSRFDLMLYHNAINEDDVSARLRGHPGVSWLNVSAMTPDRVARRISEDRADILLDLSGHTAGGSLMVLHHKPAPVQASWVAYQCTTGLSAIDYRIVDSETDPPGFESLSTERLWRLDPCHFCYRPPMRAAALPEAGEPPVLREGSGGRVTFACFANMPKINDRVIGAWARVLRQVPRSVLLIKNRGMTQADARAALIERFRTAGVNPDRLLVEGPTSGASETIAAYSRVDVALDTFPFQGMTTICEALLMGVPVVGMMGMTSGGRQGVPVMKAVGLEDLLCADEDAMARAAGALVSDTQRLRELRSTLRDRLLSSPVCDEAGWVRRFETMLRQMWRERCAAARR